jgi:lipopolysaccharide/colanic/teichoic acid biosynthesis glycosyltransferase
VIDDEATLSSSTVLSNTYIGRLVRVEQRVVAPGTLSDAATGETIRVVDPFLVGGVGGMREGRTPIRRAVSFVATLVLVVLLSPLMLLLGLIALLTTGGVLVRLPRIGQRMGEAGELKRFELLRFRTRRADGQPAPLGRLLERWELHRLAELLTVLGGNLALVGVKPLQPEEAMLLTEEWHQRRHERPAGFTGLWFVQTDQGSDLDTVIVADVYYTAMRNWRGDALLLLRTPGAWFRRALNARDGQSEREYFLQPDKVQSL